jgi:hypothetical protein
LLQLTERSAKRIYYAGRFVGLIGIVLAFVAINHRADLPTYLLITAQLPLAISWPMVLIEQYRNWDKLHGFRRAEAIFFLVPPPVVAVCAALAWFLLGSSGKV